jgi:hypothetical protein
LSLGRKRQCDRKNKKCQGDYQKLLHNSTVLPIPNFRGGERIMLSFGERELCSGHADRFQYNH